MLALRLPADIEQRLDALAKETHRTKSFYAREAILRYLDDLEDIYLAAHRQEMAKSGEKMIPLDEFIQQLDLEFDTDDDS